MNARIPMPDGNSAALRIYESEHANDSQLWESEAEGIAQGWTDNVMEGGYAFGKHWRLQDFAQDITEDEFAFLMSATRNQALDRYDDVKKKLAGRIKEFFLTKCEAEIWEVITERESER